MTEAEFKSILKEGHGFEDNLNRFTCVAIAGLGIYFIVLFKFEVISVLGLLFVVFAVYAFSKIDSDYKVFKFNSDTSIHSKWKCLEAYLEGLNIQDRYLKDGLLICVYQNRYLNKVKLSFYIDKDIILFNAAVLDIASKGIFDYGISSRATKRIEKFLNQCVMKESGDNAREESS